MSADQSDRESIAELAYLLWESRGRPAGSADQDWVEAEALFAARKASKAPTAKKSLAAIPTLDTPAKVKTERVKAERRKPRSKKSALNGELDGPSSP